jgi:threonine dehydratase
MSRTQLGLSAILTAHQRIRPYIRHTPLMHSLALSQLTGGDVWLKLENQQITGSFKVRGALNKIATLSAEEKNRGVVTGSAGNHGLGVALAAHTWGPMAANIFVPATAPSSKKNKMRRLGASLHEVGTTYEEAHQAAEAFSLNNNATYIQAYDDVDVIAGQGTMALEILSDLPQTDIMIVPIGGGGMIAGVSTTAKTANPGCHIIGVQPEASPAALLSLRDGTPYDPYDHEPTIADGLAGGFGALPFFLARALIDDILLSSEASLRHAVFSMLNLEQLVVEPSGAISVVPLLDGTLDVKGKTVVCILSGCNISTRLLRDILAEHESLEEAAL